MKEKEKKFSFFLRPVTQVRPFKVMTLMDAYRHITADIDVLNATHRLRTEFDEKERKLCKRRNFDFCTFSGVFAYRTRAHLLSHSGLLCIDLDHVGVPPLVWETRERLVSDSLFLTELCFVSPSGDGLKWVVSIDTAKYSHEQWFDAVSRYLKERYRLDADPQCRDVTRACFLPHDPGCYINPDTHLDTHPNPPQGRELKPTLTLPKGGN